MAERDKPHSARRIITSGPPRASPPLPRPSWMAVGAVMLWVAGRLRAIGHVGLDGIPSTTRCWPTVSCWSTILSGSGLIQATEGPDAVQLAVLHPAAGDHVRLPLKPEEPSLAESGMRLAPDAERPHRLGRSEQTQPAVEITP